MQLLQAASLVNCSRHADWSRHTDSCLKVQEISPCGRHMSSCSFLARLSLLHAGLASRVALGDLQLLQKAQAGLQASLLSSCSVQARPRNLYSTSAAPLLLLIHLTHLQVVVGALSVVAGGLNPEEVPEVDSDKVAVLCRDHPTGEVACLLWGDF